MEPKPLLLRLTVELLLPVILLLLVACGSESEAPAPNSLIALAKTGQTACFDGVGTVIACLGTGQDGELQTGVAEPSPRFVVGTGAAANCVTDNLTGLMWAQNANLLAGAGVPSAGARLWQPALDYANGLTLCGFTDWRLPNRNELFSLINHSVSDNAAALNVLGFSNAQASYYWSSSSLVRIGALAWHVNMMGGDVGNSSKTNVICYVWPVRAGQ